MIRHIVMFNLKPEVDDADRRNLFGQIEKLSGISSVRRLSIGELLDPRDPEYRSRMASDFQYALLVDFSDEEGLEIYQKDPYHLEVAQKIRERVSAFKGTDFVTAE